MPSSLTLSITAGLACATGLGLLTIAGSNLPTPQATDFPREPLTRSLNSADDDRGSGRLRNQARLPITPISFRGSGRINPEPIPGQNKAFWQQAYRGSGRIQPITPGVV
jgi:hypothetical protein